jgi:hypothetical protein
MLSRNVGNQLPICSSQHLRRSKTLSTLRQKPESRICYVTVGRYQLLYLYETGLLNLLCGAGKFGQIWYSCWHNDTMKFNIQTEETISVGIIVPLCLSRAIRM